jgi:hypothetical protein
MWSDRHLGGGAQLGQQLAALVDPSGSFLQGVVGRQDGAKGRDDRRRRGGRQQGGEGAVIEPQRRRQGQRVTPLPPLGRREQDLLLQADVPQQAGTELGLGGAIDRAPGRHGPPEEPVESGMVASQQGRQGSSPRGGLLNASPSPPRGDGRHRRSRASGRTPARAGHPC